MIDDGNVFGSDRPDRLALKVGSTPNFWDWDLIKSVEVRSLVTDRSYSYDDPGDAVQLAEVQVNLHDAAPLHGFTLINYPGQSLNFFLQPTCDPTTLVSYQQPDPTATPSPEWVVNVDPNSEIPPVTRVSLDPCPSKILDQKDRDACVLRTYHAYEEPLTWGSLIAVILHAEGNAVLANTDTSKCFDNTYPGIPAAPLIPPNPTPTPTPAPVPVNWVSGTQQACDNLKAEYTHAVIEQMFNLCDDETVVPDNSGQCSDIGLVKFLGGVQKWRENDLSDDTTYRDVADTGIDNFLENPNKYGVCPCTTGNVGTVEKAKEGQDRSKVGTFASPFYQPIQEHPGYWNSYSYFDNVGGADADNRYMKVY